ncbi:MAG TPA: ferritin family protein [Bacteroidota bacterium]|nr:ferritin family protein [Bacteroidota bacterium]
MKQDRTISFAQLLLLSGMLFLFLCAGAGCRQQEEIEKKPLVTPDNLQTAYNRETRLAYTYDLFAKKAEKEYLPNIAKLYRAAAVSEAIHAAGHVEQMKALGAVTKPYTPEKVVVGTTMQTLRMAVSDEQIESESMYPNLIATAEAEKLNDVAAQFRKYQRADDQQLTLFKEAASDNGVISRVPFYICPKCGGFVMTAKNPGCPNCGVKPEGMTKAI